VDAVWYFLSREGSAFVEAASAVNVKRTWVDYGLGKFTFDSRDVTKTDFMMFYSTENFLNN
jgi:aldehyde dehydrogenase (NAD+)